METTVLTITSTSSLSAESSELASSLSNFIGKEHVIMRETKAFNGSAEIIILLSIGGGVAIKEIGSIIRAWLTKDNGKKADLKKLQFSGYSANELKNIMESAIKYSKER